MERAPGTDRREFLKGLIAALATPALSESAIASGLEKQPRLALEIVALHQDLSKGGLYYRMMHGVIDEKQLHEMLQRIDFVSKELRALHFNSAAKGSAAEPYVLSKSIPGLTTKWIETGKMNVVDGKKVPARSFCNYFKVHAMGTTYEATAEHCISNNVNALDFHRNPHIGDFAVRRLSPAESAGPALALDSRTTNDSLSGCLGLTIGSKNGVVDAFYSPLIKMTPQMYRYFFKRENLTDTLGQQVQSGFWKILPTEQGDDESVINGQSTVRAQGRSGSIELAYDPRMKGFTVAGNFIAVKKYHQGVFAGQTIGFYTGPDAMRSLIEDERGDVPFHGTQTSSAVMRAPKPPEPRSRRNWLEGLFDNK